MKKGGIRGIQGEPPGRHIPTFYYNNIEHHNYITNVLSPYLTSAQTSPQTPHTHLKSTPPNKLHITIRFPCDIQNKSQSKHRCPQIRKKPQKNHQKILKFYTHMHTSISHHSHHHPYRHVFTYMQTPPHRLLTCIHTPFPHNWTH